VSTAGFREHLQKGIVVTVGATVTMNVALQVGPTSDRVEVTGQPPQLQSDTSEISTVVKSDYILDLPLSVDGTVRNPVYSSRSYRLFRGNRGRRVWANKLNGASGMHGYPGGRRHDPIDRPSIPSFNYGVSVEAVQEFRVQTNNFSAEYGRTSSGIVNLVMKSGANSPHGSVYEFFRNRVFDSNDFFSNRAGIDSRSKNQNDYGFVASGRCMSRRSSTDAIRFSGCRRSKVTSSIVRFRSGHDGDRSFQAGRPLGAAADHYHLRPADL